MADASLEFLMCNITILELQLKLRLNKHPLSQSLFDKPDGGIPRCLPTRRYTVESLHIRDAIRRGQKMNMSIFRRSRVV